MRYNYILTVLASLSILSACHNHNHHHHSSHEEHEHHLEAHEERKTSDEIVISEQTAENLGIKSEVATKKDFQTSIQSFGLITSSSENSISLIAKSSGIITWENGKAFSGKAFEKNELIASINSEGFVEGNSINRIKNNYELAKKQYERAKSLYENKIISEKEFIEVETEFKNAENAAKNLNTKGLEIICPDSSYLQTIYKNTGDYVTEGETIAILTLKNKATLKVNLPQKYSNLEIKGVEFKTEYSDTIYSLNHLSSKGTSLQSSFIPLYFEFENKDNLVLESFVNAWILSEIKENTLTVPLSAILEEQGDFFIFIQLDEDCYIKRKVSLGLKNSTEVEILNGLEEGEAVVVSGALQVKLSKASVIPGHTHNH